MPGPLVELGAEVPPRSVHAEGGGRVAVALAILPFAAVAAVIAARSRGYFDADDLKHFQLARGAWTYPAQLLDWWGHPAFTIPYALVANVGSQETGLLLSRLLTVAFACATAFLTAGMARLAGVRRPALAALFLLATPVYFRLSFATLTEVVDGLWLAAGTYLLLSGRSRLAALCIGFAPLGRHEVVVYLAPLCVYLAWRREWLACLLSLAPLALWNAADYAVVRDLPLLRSAGTAAHEHALWGTGSKLHFVRQWGAFSGLALASLTIAGCALGLAGRWRVEGDPAARRWRRVVAWAIPAAALGLVAVEAALFLPGMEVSGGYARFLGPAAPWMAVAAAAAADRLLDGIRDGRAPRAVIAVVVLAALALRLAAAGGLRAALEAPLPGIAPSASRVLLAALLVSGVAAFLLPRRRAPGALLCLVLAVIAARQWRDQARVTVPDAEDAAVARLVAEVRRSHARAGHPLYALIPAVDWYDRAVTRWTVDHWPPTDWAAAPRGALLVYDLKHMAPWISLAWVEARGRLVASTNLHPDEPVPFLRVYEKVR